MLCRIERRLCRFEGSEGWKQSAGRVNHPGAWGPTSAVRPHSAVRSRQEVQPCELTAHIFEAFKFAFVYTSHSRSPDTLYFSEH